MRRFARPFVFTVAGSALACGGVESTASSGPDASDATTVLPDADATSADVAPPTGCAAHPQWGCGAGPIGDVCKRSFACSSGSHELDLVCSETGAWELVPVECALPFDFCDSQDSPRQPLCSGGAWRLTNIPAGANPPPPPPCSLPRPDPHQECYSPAICGYWCADQTSWVVATCTPEPASSTNYWWVLDPPCPKPDAVDGG